MKINPLLYISLLFLMAACAGENEVEKQKKLLLGKWEIIEGKRNGLVTASLEGTSFEFMEGDKMSTNLPIPGGTNSVYRIEENIIFQVVVNDLEVKYKIEQLTETSLILSTNLRGYDFVFNLERAALEEAVNAIPSD